MIVKNDLYDYKNRMIFQDSNGFKFSLDSILLAEFANNIKRNSNVLDMCSGNCVIPLILSAYTNANYISFEIQKEVYDLGVQSIKYNRLSNINVINDDIKNVKNYFPNNFFDVITCNPPFFKVNDDKVTNEDIHKKIARHEVYLTLEDIFRISKDALKDNGVLYLVHRPDRLDELFINASKYNLNIKVLQLIATKKDANPSIVLVKCNKNSKMGVKVNNFKCIENLKTYQNMFKELK